MNILRRIYRLLLPTERKQALTMAASTFATALLDLLGLAALLPVLYFLLGRGGQDRAALLFSLLAVAVIVVKCLLTTLLTRYQNQCLLSFYRRLSYSLFSSYYRRGLLFVRERGSTQLGHEINAMCYAFSHSLVAPICRIASDVLLIVLVTVALLVWDGLSVLILFASFVPFMCVYFFCIRRRVREYGAEDMRAKREQAKVVAETFRGYVDIEVNGAFHTLQRSFLEGMDRISHNRLHLDMLLRLPTLLSELSVIIALTLLVIFGQGDLVMLVGTFAVAAFRLLPAMRSTLAGWTQIQNALCCLDTIEEGLRDYDEEPVAESSVMPFEREITMHRVTYAYPDGEPIIQDFDCRIAKGEYVGIQGMSGAGKSTLFNLLIGLIRPLSGEIRIDGVALTPATRASWIAQIGYVPQEVFIFNGTLAENIALGCTTIDRHRLRHILEQVSLESWVQTLPEGIDTLLNEAGTQLSGGQKQRIGIARALYKQASVLLLDEATSALDDATERDIHQTLQQLRASHEGLTILSIAHRESSLKPCERILTI